MAPTKRPVHLVTVLHGLWGAPSHIRYVVESVTRHAQQHNTGFAADNTQQPKMVVLAPSTNAESFSYTYDGIDVCADRVLAEIDAELDRIRSEDPLAEVTKFSIVGYSLGGLIARFVLGLLDSRSPSFFDRVEPVHFATFASPAIGIPHYDTFWASTFRFLGSRLLSRTGHQLYERDRFLPERFTNPDKHKEAANAAAAKSKGFGRYLPRGSKRERAEPLLKIMADPRYSFYRALVKFKHVDVFANTVNDRTVPFPTGAIEAHDPFALARAKAKAVADKRGDDSDLVPDIREGGLEVRVLPGTPLVESYGPPDKPYIPHPSPPRRRRFRLRLPFLLRPTSYPFSRPVSLFVICFLPIALPLSVGYLVTRFALQGRESRRRIRDARRARGEGREGMLMRVGVRIGEIAEQVGGDNPEYAADLDADGEVEVEGAEEDGARGSAAGNGEASRRQVVRPSGETSAGTTSTAGDPAADNATSSSSGGSSARSASPLLSNTSPSTPPTTSKATTGPAPSTAAHAEALALHTDPSLSPSQLFQIKHLNAIPQLKKHFVYLPHARNAHGAIIRRDPTIAMHREGKKVVDAWVAGFEI